MKQLFYKLSVFEKNIYFFVLLLAVFLFILLRIPSLFEPAWYGDEGINQVLGMGIQQGRLLYKEVWDNKPPLLYLFYALFNGDLYSVKLFSLLFGALSIVPLFLLSKKLFKKKQAVYLTVYSYSLLLGIPLLEGNIANAENFMLAPVILSALLLWKKDMKYYVLAGLLLSFAFLIKIVAVFDFTAFLLYLLILKSNTLSRSHFNIRAIAKYITKRKFSGTFKNEAILILSFLIPIILTYIFFFFRGAFSDYFRATLSANVGYVGYGNFFIFPMGKLFLKTLILSVFIFGLYYFRKKIGTNSLFIYIWLGFSIFNALFSDRPYTHYLLVMLPSLCLMLGLCLEKPKPLFLNSALLLLVLYVFTSGFFVHKRISKHTVMYYQNFIDFISNAKSIKSYYRFFDKNTPRDYAIAEFIRVNTDEKETVFLWSDSAQIYALSNKLPPGKYAVSYHVTFYKNGIQETMQAIDNVKPKYIIETKNTREGYIFLQNYRLKSVIKEALIYERKI